MIFEKAHYISIRRDRCFNKRHQAVICDHCLDDCPAGAILLDGCEILLDRDACMGCGLCLSDCPTQVFYSGQWDETTIIETIEREKWGSVDFFCGRHTAPFGEKNDASGAVRIPACLAVVSRGAWFEIGRRAGIQLHMDQCCDCDLSETNKRLTYNIEVAAEWLEASGHPPDFKYSVHERRVKKKKSLKATDKGLRVLSRRDLILRLIGKGKANRNITKREQRELVGNAPQWGSESLLPDWHQRLAKNYCPAGEEDPSPTYWPVIQKSEVCINCGTCVAICPTKTLQIDTSSQKCEHTFTSGLCLDCRVCQSFCPVAAIDRSREKIVQPFESQVLLVAEPIRCKRCDRSVFNPSLGCAIGAPKKSLSITFSRKIAVTCF